MRPGGNAQNPLHSAVRGAQEEAPTTFSDFFTDMVIRAGFGRVNETHCTTVRDGPETKAKIAVSSEYPAKLMMTYVKLELLGTRVGNLE